MKNKKICIFIALFIAGTIAGCLFWVNKNQNIPKTFYFAGTKLSIMPELVKEKVGNIVSVQLLAETENDAKISSIDTQICYGNGLELNETETASQVELDGASLGTLVDASVTGDETKCLRLVAIANLDKKPSELASGTIKIATINFTASAAGDGEIKIDGAKTKVGGYNPKPGATDSAIKIEEIKDAKYVISE